MYIVYCEVKRKADGKVIYAGPTASAMHLMAELGTDDYQIRSIRKFDRGGLVDRLLVALLFVLVGVFLFKLIGG